MMEKVMMNNIIKDKMKSVEMDQNDNKKVWMAPLLEILDGSKTYQKNDQNSSEDPWAGDYAEDGALS